MLTIVSIVHFTPFKRTITITRTFPLCAATNFAITVFWLSPKRQTFDFSGSDLIQIDTSKAQA